MATLTEIVRQALEIAADPRRAEQMAAYMKHKQAFLGVQAPQVKEIAGGAARELKPKSMADCEPILRDLWQGQWREDAKTDPDWVRGFVSAHEEQLSRLSRKEALRNL